MDMADDDDDEEEEDVLVEGARQAIVVPAPQIELHLDKYAALPVAGDRSSQLRLPHDESSSDQV